MLYVSFSISINFLSWIIGMIISEFIRTKAFYIKLSSLNFIKSEKINKLIGIGVFKWVVKNTFFKYFNPKLKLNRRIDKVQLQELRKEMNYAEINHLIAFVCVAVFMVVLLVKGKLIFALVLMLVNVIMNLYPSLLQQENKRQIDSLIKRFSYY